MRWLIHTHDDEIVLIKSKGMSNIENVHRFGQLCGLVSKPELNGLYIIVETYSVKKGRYGVKTLVPPNSTADSVSILVKLANIRFPQANTFSSKFPNPLTQPGSSLFTAYSHGTILDFSNVQWVQLEGSTAKSRSQTFEGSCRILGATSASVSGGQPMTQFPERIVLAPADTDTYPEVVNIDFTNGDVRCTRGESTIFRNCRFSGKEGFIVGDDHDMGATVGAVVESCLFEGIIGRGALITPGTKVSFLNCTFRNCKLAVHIVEGGSAVFTHCSFVNCGQGISMPSKAGTLEITNCSFNQGKTAICIGNGGVTNVCGCRIQGFSSAAIVVEGPKTTVLNVESCVIRECRNGVTAGTGKVRLTMRNTEITRQTFIGLLLMDSMLGTVNVSNCVIEDNAVVDVMNVCGPTCPVTIDDKLQRSDDHQERRTLFQPLRLQLIERERAIAVTNFASLRCSLKRLRTLKLAGVEQVRCAHCGIQEPMEVKFKICAKCENVVYCTRKCQVTHWKEYKKACGIIEYK